MKTVSEAQMVVEGMALEKQAVAEGVVEYPLALWAEMMREVEVEVVVAEGDVAVGGGRSMVALQVATEVDATEEEMKETERLPAESVEEAMVARMVENEMGGNEMREKMA
mmetsp:Transcript_34376/g.56916  ORF Transcript_34376/g.56916 Transcript_34376/m.56916 type:complete len:110 (+) Transcript_34376:885-1214(+)